MRILTYNILKGGQGREGKIAAVVNEVAPDLVILQEATRPDIVERLAQLTGMAHCGAHRGRSLAFISRLPIAEQRWIRPRWSQHAFLEIVPEGTNVRIFGVHLSAVHAAWTEARRVRELRSLLAAIKQHDRSHHVLVGDFNTVAPDERLDLSKLPRRLRALVWLSGGRIRWQTIAIVLGAGYVDGFRAHDPTAAGFTFPTWDPHIRLDYVFLPRSFAHHLGKCRVVDIPSAGLASDHFPVYAELDPQGAPDEGKP